jgi:hypothetical protein
MKLRLAPVALFVSLAGCGVLIAQSNGPAYGGPADRPAAQPPIAEVPAVPLEWTPPALTQLSTQAASKSSFTLDRSMLTAAAGIYGDMDADTKQAINKLDGLSVHVLRFNNEAGEDPVLVDEIRDAYHLRGWKHVISAGDGGTVHDSATDVWVVMEGANFRGAVVLVDSPKSLTLATVAGNLSPVDLLHLRGHFGIPQFDGDKLHREQ